MSTEEAPKKQRFTCPNCGNNVSAPPEDVLDPVDCPHCGKTGMFTPAKPKPGQPEDSKPAKVSEEPQKLDSAADALAASEFPSEEPPPESSSSPAAHTRKAPPRRKKSVTPPRRAGDLSPGRSRPGYRRQGLKTAPPPPAEGISLLTVFLVIVAVVMSVIIVMIIIPKNLNSIQGYPAKSLSSAATPRNLLAEVQEILGPRDRAVAFTETEVNAYLNHRIQGIQRGPMKGMVKFKGAYADFEKNRVELFIERTVIGIPFTMSVRVTKTRFENKTNWRAGGGSIGKFGLSSRQFKPIIDAFMRMGVACEEEMDAIQRMGDVRFENDRVILDPAFGGGSPVKAAEPKPKEAPAPPPPPAPAAEPGADPAMEPEKMETNMEGANPAMSPATTESADPAMEPGAMEEKMEGDTPATDPKPKPDGDPPATDPKPEADAGG